MSILRSYTTEQKNAVERQDIKDGFRIGHRQWQNGITRTNSSGGNDAVTVYFSSWWKKSASANAYVYMKGCLETIFLRVNKIMVIVDTPDKAFLDVRVPREIEGGSGVGTVLGVVRQYLNYNGIAGRYKKVLEIRREYAAELDNQFGTNGDKRLSKFICRHEALHVLGFEHPFANDDGDIDLNLSVLDTDLDYPSTTQKLAWVKDGTVNGKRIAGPLDRKVMDERMRSQYN